MTKSERWILSEYQVARDRVAHFNDKLLDHRYKTPYAEIDLIFESPPLRGQTASSLTVVEVKSVSAGLWGREVISRSQRQRLERARWFIELKESKRTRLILATVEPGEVGGSVIRYFDAPFS